MSGRRGATSPAAGEPSCRSPTYAIIGLTVAVSVAAMLSTDGASIYGLLELEKPKIAAGELWRLWTVTLLHDPNNLLHLLFNMYALYLVGSHRRAAVRIDPDRRLLPRLRPRRLARQLRVRERRALGRGVRRDLRAVRDPARRDPDP